VACLQWAPTRVDEEELVEESRRLEEFDDRPDGKRLDRVIFVEAREDECALLAIRPLRGHSVTAEEEVQLVVAALALGHDFVDDLQDVVLGRDEWIAVRWRIVLARSLQGPDLILRNFDVFDEPAGELLSVVDRGLEVRRVLPAAVLVDADDDRPAQGLVRELHEELHSEGVLLLEVRVLSAYRVVVRLLVVRHLTPDRLVKRRIVSAPGAVVPNL
jgi:hypothetical protein